MPQTFPNQAGMWQLTAAQRAILMGPDKKKGKVKGAIKRLSMKELEELSARGAAQEAAARAAQQAMNALGA